jgi:hypothetical protein
VATLTCPYCYHKQAPAELYFVCDGQGSPGWESCIPRKDNQREQHTGYSGLAMPTFAPKRSKNGANPAPGAAHRPRGGPALCATPRCQ